MPPCIERPSCFGSVRTQYAGTAFESHLEELSKSLQKIRRVRRDGNCFYSALLFLLMEHAASSPEGQAYVKDIVEKSRAQLVNYFEEYIVEEFADPLREHLETPAPLDALDDSFWSYSTVYIRMVTSATIQGSPKFREFIGGDAEARAYAKRRVEVNCEYAGEMEIAAATEGLSVQMEVVSLEVGSMQRYMRGGGPFIGSLLYVPDHFDIIYPHALNKA
jgi:ubiquitin thioesterase protein OTUB1